MLWCRTQQTLPWPDTGVPVSLIIPQGSQRIGSYFSPTSLGHGRMSCHKDRPMEHFQNSLYTKVESSYPRFLLARRENRMCAKENYNLPRALTSSISWTRVISFTHLTHEVRSHSPYLGVWKANLETKANLLLRYLGSRHLPDWAQNCYECLSMVACHHHCS